MKTFLILFVALVMAAFVVEGRGSNKGGDGGGSFDPKKECSVKSFWKEKGPNKRYHVTMNFTGKNPQGLHSPYYMFSSDGKTDVNCASLFNKCECAKQLKGAVAEISCVTGDTSQLPVVPGKGSIQVNYGIGPEMTYCEKLLLANAPELEKEPADPVAVGPSTDELQTQFDPKKECSVKSFWKEKGPNKRYHFTTICTGPNLQSLHSPYYIFSPDGITAKNCASLFNKCECAIQLKGPVAEISCVTGDTSQLPVVPNKAFVQTHYGMGTSWKSSENLLLANATELEKVNTILLHHAALDIYQLISPIPTTQPATNIRVEYLSNNSDWNTVTNVAGSGSACNSLPSAANCLVSIAQPEMPPVESAKVRLSSTETGTSGAVAVPSPIALAESMDAGVLKGALLSPYTGTYSLDNVLFRTTGCAAPAPATRKSIWQQTIFKQAPKMFGTAGDAFSSKGSPVMGQLTVFENGAYFLSIVIPGQSTMTQAGIIDFEEKNFAFYINTGDLNRGFLAGYSYAMTFNGLQFELALNDPDAQSMACTADAIQSINLKRMN